MFTFAAKVLDKSEECSLNTRECQSYIDETLVKSEITDVNALLRLRKRNFVLGKHVLRPPKLSPPQSTPMTIYFRRHYRGLVIGCACWHHLYHNSKNRINFSGIVLSYIFDAEDVNQTKCGLSHWSNKKHLWLTCDEIVSLPRLILSFLCIQHTRGEIDSYDFISSDMAWSRLLQPSGNQTWDSN